MSSKVFAHYYDVFLFKCRMVLRFKVWEGFRHVIVIYFFLFLNGMILEKNFCRNPTLRQVWGWSSHSQKSGYLKSCGTPEILKFDCRGQNTSPWGVFYTIEKVSKCRFQKWPRMSHLDIWSTSYGQKKGRELNYQLPTTKSRESTRPRCVQRECDTPLESSRRELQLYFKPCLDRRSEREVMTSQSPGGPSRDSFETPLWESRDKKPFGRGCGGVTQRILYGGRWWPPPSPSCGESSESKVARGLSQHQKYAEWVIPNLLVGFGCKTK